MTEATKDNEETVIHAPATYAKMSEPFESLEAMNEAWLAFQTELYELRKKHRIRDLTTIMSGAYLHDGEPADGRVTLHHGSSLQKLPGLAFAYGEAKAEQEQMLVEQEQVGAKRARRQR